MISSVSAPTTSGRTLRLYQRYGLESCTEIPKKIMDPAPIGAGWVLTTNRNSHIKDFALEVLNGLISMPQGAYRRVGP
ncbi:hypothetical protein BY996DRAFT_6563761 [Phakopsora pachyrhizi]|uniref:Uncharacterized protein n=1 Tax=Phakopsora pachyrhizi TaxID=170000 RepID=A0AAV0AKV0_PHAPC|nr:hypothetical protein BY996DRAFT_6563761 [Phakopsora pachyrhizi]CAH7669014.1 hypothetical protein PPACK8108_LOCUS3573 [Phakopsora pachyrhizi]